MIFKKSSQQHDTLCLLHSIKLELINCMMNIRLFMFSPYFFVTTLLYWISFLSFCNEVWPSSTFVFFYVVQWCPLETKTMSTFRDQ